jgi:hypothetical protein
MSKTETEFEIGDIVTWKSQAGGVWKEKTGAVVIVGVPGQLMANGRHATNRHRYVVEVTVKHSRGEKKVQYMPSTSAMTKTSQPSQSMQPMSPATQHEQPTAP